MLKTLISQTANVIATALCLLIMAGSCETTPHELTLAEEQLFEKALQNAVRANEGFIRCDNYMNAWLSFADPVSKLVPRTLDRDKDIWNANDCAADNFPFLVLTSYFTDSAKYNGVMRDMLRNEIRLTSRVKSLPDTYSFSRQGFLYDSVSMPRVVFGTTEYIKDGLLPITEWLGHSPWSERMITMLNDLNEYVDVAGGFGKGSFGSAPEDEVNGELLQILSRVYWMTGDKQYLDWAIQIGEHFVGDAYPIGGNYLRLRDHGCEIISGLCELYVALHHADPQKNAALRLRLHTLLDFVLEYGRNTDGFFFNAINPKTGEAVEERLADTWGYTLNGFYSVYMVDSVDRYREAVTEIFSNLHKYHNFDWENLGADGYADAVEGALNLYNRVRDVRAAKWIDAEISVMWSMQDSAHRANAQQWKNTGIIEGWYGDGNFARTTIMYNLWKSKGTHVQPWRHDLMLGAETKGDSLYIVLQSETAWSGRLYFDRPRHSMNMKLPVDWPRINQFPEWFKAETGRDYTVTEAQTGSSRKYPGRVLAEGLQVTLAPGERTKLIVAPLASP